MFPLLALIALSQAGAALSPAAPAAPAATATTSARHAAPSAIPNDNRRPAGTLDKGVLTVRLEARTGMWYPEGPNGRGLEVAAWAEGPGAPQVPGPLIRVPVGTEVRATLRNTLQRPLTVYGFGAVRGPADSVVVAPGAERDVRFTATTPGTYYYSARSAPGPFGFRLAEDSQLNGAIVVDDAGARGRYDDRVFLISWWFTLDSTSKTGLGRATMAINGLSWPHTERIDLVQGDSVRWRVVNLTETDHPMHLHGFYFRMESKGDGILDTAYTGEQQRLAVTEIINPFQTITFAWAPTRPGNWIYHCHFSGHLSSLVSLDNDRGMMDMGALSHHASDRPHQMYGLVLGIRVAPRGPVLADRRVPRALRLEVREKPHVYGDHAGFAFVLDGTPEASNPDALPAPGSMLLLRRGERVAVTVVNHSQEPASVHWHGIELESYPDGVPGWSGGGSQILPSIAPGDSLTVRFTPPRSGTFMYHSHFNEEQQINSGLYAPIVVLDSGQTFDPETDRVLMFTSAGTVTNVITGPFPRTLLNGQAEPPPMDLRAGTTYRFRLIDMTGDQNTIVSLLSGDKPVEWRAVAKDGAALPAHQATMRPATVYFDPGEIYDFEYTPKAAGNLALRFGLPPGPPGVPIPPPVDVAVRVK
jgi:FtsP/CotA-like multicopper oxidase with cupredoxin domain